MPAQPSYEDGDYSSVLIVSPLEKQTAFDGVNIKYIGKQSCVQNRADYTPLALDTPHPDDPDFLLVKEDSFTDLGEGKDQWVRTYAKIPALRVEGRAIPWQVPGLGIGDGHSNYAAVVSATNSTATPPVTSLVLSDNLQVTKSDGTLRDVQAGDKIFIIWNKIVGGFATEYFTASIVGTVTDAKNFTLVKWEPIAAGLQPKYVVADPFPAANINSVYRGRRPEQKKVNAFVAFEYFLSADGTDLTISTPPLIKDEAGNKTDTYTVLTTPSLTDYAAQITAANDAANDTFQKLLAADALIVAEASQPRRWLGNIWEVETIYVKAQ